MSNCIDAEELREALDSLERDLAVATGYGERDADVSVDELAVALPAARAHLRHLDANAAEAARRAAGGRFDADTGPAEGVR